MKVLLSAVETWKKANPPATDVEAAAQEMIADNFAARLAAGGAIAYAEEIEKILRSTDGDEASRALLLDQISGIAEKQNLASSMFVRETIETKLKRSGWTP